MNQSKTRVTRKKVIPKHYQKSQTSLSQILTAASCKKRIKELQKNNKVLAVALQDSRIDLAYFTSLLQRCATENAKILHAKTKMKNVVTSMQTIVTDLSEVMSCLEPKPINFFNSSPDKVRLKITRPDLDPIEESDSNEDCKKISDADSNAAVEDKIVTGTPKTSIPPVSSPASPLTPVLDISQSDEYLRCLLNLNHEGCPPKNVTLDNEVNATSPLKGNKSVSRIPLRNKNPLPLQQLSERSPHASKPNRKTFVVKKDAIQSSQIEMSGKPNSSSSANHSDRRRTYKLTAVPEIASPNIIKAPSEAMKITDANLHCNEDMELTGIVPMYKISPVNKIFANHSDRRRTYNLTAVPEIASPNIIKAPSEAMKITDANLHCSEDMELTGIVPISKISPANKIFAASNLLPKKALSIVSEEKNIAASDNNTSKPKCMSINQDMEFTCAIPMQVVSFTTNNPSQDLNFASTCANDLQLNTMRNITVESGKSLNKSTPKLVSDKQDSADKSIVSGQVKVDIVLSDLPTLKCSDPVDCKVIQDSLKRRSSVSSKIRGRKVSDSKATLSRNKRLSINSKGASPPKSPKLSMDLKAVSPNEISTSTSKSIARKRKTVTFSEFLSPVSDTDNEACSPNLLNMPPYVKVRKSSMDYESNSVCKSADGFSSFGRCSLKSPKKTSKKRHIFTFEKYRKSSKVQSEKCNEKKSVTKIDTISILDLDDPSPIEIEKISPKSNSSGKSSPKSLKVSNKKSSKNFKLSEQLKSLDEKTAIDAVIVSETNKESLNEEAFDVSQREIIKNVEVESVSVLNTVTSPSDEKCSAYNAMSTYKKSVQLAVNECYDAFRNLETREKVVNECKNLTEKIGNPRSHSVPGLSEPNQGVVKKGIPSQKRPSRRLSYISNSADNTKDLPKPSQTGPTKLDLLLASLDFTIGEDGCNSKDEPSNHNLIVQSVETDEVRRPFSGVSERTSKKRSIDYGNDVFNEIDAMCPREILPSLGTIQQNKETAANSCEEAEVYNRQDVLKTKTRETGFKQSHSPQNKCQNVELKVKKSISNKNSKDDVHLIQDIVISDKTKTKNQNLEMDILAIGKMPLKDIQLTSTEACSSTASNTCEKIIDNQKSKEKKPQKEKKTKLKETSHGCKSTRSKKSNVAFHDQNANPLTIPEPLCAINEDNSFASSKSSTNLGIERPRRARAVVSLKEPSLKSKKRR